MGSKIFIIQILHRKSRVEENVTEATEIYDHSQFMRPLKMQKLSRVPRVLWNDTSAFFFFFPKYDKHLRQEFLSRGQ